MRIALCLLLLCPCAGAQDVPDTLNVDDLFALTGKPTDGVFLRFQLDNDRGILVVQREGELAEEIRGYFGNVSENLRKQELLQKKLNQVLEAETQRVTREEAEATDVRARALCRQRLRFVKALHAKNQKDGVVSCLRLLRSNERWNPEFTEVRALVETVSLPDEIWRMNCALIIPSGIDFVGMYEWQSDQKRLIPHSLIANSDVLDQLQPDHGSEVSFVPSLRDVLSPQRIVGYQQDDEDRWVLRLIREPLVTKARGYYEEFEKNRKERAALERRWVKLKQQKIDSGTGDKYRQDSDEDPEVAELRRNIEALYPPLPDFSVGEVMEATADSFSLRDLETEQLVRIALEQILHVEVD